MLDTYIVETLKYYLDARDYLFSQYSKWVKKSETAEDLNLKTVYLNNANKCLLELQAVNHELDLLNSLYEVQK